MKAKGLILIVAALLLVQIPAFAIQPDRWASPAPGEGTEVTAEVKQPDLGEGARGIFDFLMTPFRLLTGGEKAAGK